MKTIATALMCACLALAAGAASTQDNTKRDGAAEDGVMKKDWTIKDCKDHMAMSKKDGTKKDDAMMKMEGKCADMMKDGKMTKGGSADDRAMNKNWTIEDCKAHMATPKKDGMKGNDAMTTMDKHCANMMKDGKMN
jgi:hypothetical protein